VNLQGSSLFFCGAVVVISSATSMGSSYTSDSRELNLAEIIPAVVLETSSGDRPKSSGHKQPGNA